MAAFFRTATNSNCAPQCLWCMPGLFRSHASAALRCFVLFISGCILIVLNPQLTAAQVPPGENESASAIVVGFLGGFVRADEVHRPEAQLIDRLRTSYGDKVCAGIFENRQIRKAHDLIRECLDQDKSGELSGNEKRQTTIILFGHSWGASAAVTLARKLQQDGIPVSLTVQVDNISKHGEDDSIIPPNVAEAANFYQTGGILHGSRIRAANPLSTVIISNTRLRYRGAVPTCRAYSWYERLLAKGHYAIECDPSVWMQIETLIRTRLAGYLAQNSEVAAASSRTAHVKGFKDR